MARPLRFDFPGAWHHVMNRGAERRAIFRQPHDQTVFLELLTSAFKPAAVELHAYCLMGNHFHLLVRSSRGNLPDAMRVLSGKFTQTLNYRDRTDGPLFRGRYASVPVKSDAHLLQASRYIHLNPVVAKLTASAIEWQWSSCAAYVTGRTDIECLRTNEILEMFGPCRTRDAYREFLDAGIDADTRDFYDRAWGLNLGSDPWV